VPHIYAPVSQRPMLTKVIKESIKAKPRRKIKKMELDSQNSLGLQTHTTAL
jgi:hypothetical protein